MKFSRHQAIRELLITADDGMTIKEIAQKLGSTPDAIRKSIKAVWGIYVDRWVKVTRGAYASVYMCVDVPEDAPRPDQIRVPSVLWVKSQERSRHEIHC